MTAIWGGLSRYILHGGFEMPAYRPILERARAIAGTRAFLSTGDWSSRRCFSMSMGGSQRAAGSMR